MTRVLRLRSSAQGTNRRPRLESSMTSDPRPHDLDSELISRVTRGIEQIRAGKMLILVDDEDRENEGDLVLAADHVTPEAIAFMANHARGLICLTLTDEQIG